MNSLPNIAFWGKILSKIENPTDELFELSSLAARMRCSQPVIDLTYRRATLASLASMGEDDVTHLFLEDPPEVRFEVVRLKWREPFEEPSSHQYICYRYLFLLTRDNHAPNLLYCSLTETPSWQSKRCSSLSSFQTL